MSNPLLGMPEDASRPVGDDVPATPSPSSRRSHSDGPRPGLARADGRETRRVAFVPHGGVMCIGYAGVCQVPQPTSPMLDYLPAAPGYRIAFFVGVMTHVSFGRRGSHDDVVRACIIPVSVKNATAWRAMNRSREPDRDAIAARHLRRTGIAVVLHEPHPERKARRLLIGDVVVF